MISDPAAETSTIPLAAGKTTPAATAPTPSAKRPRVLLVGHADGWIELFADQGLDARFVMLPDAEGTDGEILAEDWASLQLPRRHREIYLPGRLELVDQIRRERPSDVARRDTLVRLHRAISRMGASR